MKKPTLVIAVGEKKKPRKNYLDIPEGFDLPKIEEGDTFEAVVEIKREKGGGNCVTTIDGVPMEKEKSEDTEWDETETIGAGAKNAMKGYV